MQDRIIKFRAWVNGRMVDWREMMADAYFHDFFTLIHLTNPTRHVATMMQFTGLQDKDGKDIYEGDIFRIEEDGDGVDQPDRMFYIVITWVKEWCMFASLLSESEYVDYVYHGVKKLHEPMFWTYTLEDTNSKKHYLCGNIYENPELLSRSV